MYPYCDERVTTMTAYHANSNEMIMRAPKLRRGLRSEKRFAVVAMAMLCLCAHHNPAEAADKAGAAPQDFARGLVGHWTFDDGKGSIARDVSGRGNHGTVMGGAKWTQGIIGGALEFDGMDDFVSIPNESKFDITGSVTVRSQRGKKYALTSKSLRSRLVRTRSRPFQARTAQTTTQSAATPRLTTRCAAGGSAEVRSSIWTCPRSRTSQGAPSIVR